MGYCVNMNKAKFKILNENKNKALELLKEYVSKNNQLDFGDKDVLLSSSNLAEALEECRYEIEEDAEGNIMDIQFQGKKLGQDKEIFNAIASVVEDDSYIEMSGEDGTLWRWIFKDGYCKEIEPKINWNQS